VPAAESSDVGMSQRFQVFAPMLRAVGSNIGTGNVVYTDMTFAGG
jgi:hypothetical protein